MNAPVDDTLLEITREFDAPPGRVFSAWLNCEEWQAWIGPEGRNCDVTRLEPHVGGRYRIIVRLTDGREFPVVGIYKIIDAPTALSFTWGPESDPLRQSLISVGLRATATGGTESRTELTLRQDSFPNAASRDSHIIAWNGTLNKLDAHLAPAARET